MSILKNLHLPGVRDRFLKGIDIRGPDECWPWKRGRFERGYGAFTCRQKSLRAHRVAFFYAHGKFPKIGRHTCDNPPCCNPSHIINGTTLDNVRDRNARGRTARGERAARAQLTSEQVIEIRLDPREQRQIAKSYGVCKSTIGYIKRGETWRHV